MVTSALVRAGRAATRPGRQRPQASARQDCLMGWNRNDRALRQSTRITVISGISGAIAILQRLKIQGQRGALHQLGITGNPESAGIKPACRRGCKSPDGKEVA